MSVTKIENTPAAGLTEDQIADNIGFNTQRIWCNAFVLSRAPGSAILVIKEAINVNNPGGEDMTMSRNLLSLVMPEDSARQLRDALVAAFPTEQADAS